jgi:tRNA1(Val) A37 N6-methylase TrmN6
MRVHRRSEFRPSVPEIVLDKVIELAAIEPNDHVANPCCGNGDLAVAVARRAGSLVCFDLDTSPLLAGWPMTWHHMKAKRCHFLSLRFDLEPELPGAFDKAVMVVPTGDDEKRFVEKALHLLKPGGTMVCVLSAKSAAEIARFADDAETHEFELEGCHTLQAVLRVQRP